MTCPTCGAAHAGDRPECGTCARRWSRARRSRGFLPTVELFPELAPAPEPPPAKQTSLDLGD